MPDSDQLSDRPKPDPDCTNCDGRGCMGCVLREYDHDCKDDCPFCCSEGAWDPFARTEWSRALERGHPTDEMVEAAAHELYAAGPWGEFITFLDGGVRAITDAHTMEHYRGMVRLVFDTLRAGPIEAGCVAPDDLQQPEEGAR